MPVDDREPAAAGPLRDNACWCGADDLRPFSATYSVCGSCQTLITRFPYTATQFLVQNDTQDFYGRDYWFSHQETDLEQPGILTRSRTDLAERAIHWLRAVLKYKLPPGRVVELGSAHGGLVALLQYAGFEAAGLEMSPWVVGFARDTFGVPMYQGTLEQQQIDAASLDAIVLMDVLEHLPDPVGTMQKAASLLKPDGILVIQTPRFDPPTAYAEMVERDDPFLVQLKTDEHLFLFSENSVTELLRRAGIGHVRFEPAIFGHYDMFVVAGASPLTTAADDAIWRALSQSPGGRIVQALLDLADQRDAAQQRYGALVPLRADVEYLKNQIAVCEEDRAARLEVIQRQGAAAGERDARIAHLEHEWTTAVQECAALTRQVEALRTQLEQLGQRLDIGLQTAGEARQLVTRVRQGSVLRFARAVRPAGADAALARAESILSNWERQTADSSTPVRDPEPK